MEEIDVTTLTLEDIQEEYMKLLDRYRELKVTSEADAQQIYDLKRNLETATAAEAYLTQELELISNVSIIKQTETDTKTLREYEDLRRKYNILETDTSTLQEECDKLRDENSRLLTQLHKVKNENDSIQISQINTSKLEERIILLEHGNMELIKKLEDFHEAEVQHTISMAERDRNIEILRDQLKCLDENIRYKREELDEKTQQLESVQEQLTEANSQIAFLTAAPDGNDKKGNSLFAEVDDQRQFMKKLLATQKASYLQMKKAYNESEYEIRRLKRENVAMHNELRACSTIFCDANKTYHEKLKERIQHLDNQNEGLKKKLMWTDERLMDLAKDKGILCFNTMFNFCKQETEELKKQLHSAHIQKAILEEQLRNTKQDMARWRFESLKSRCLLLDRENLLTEHKIDFKRVQDVEINITEEQIENARPHIKSGFLGNDVNHGQGILCDDEPIRAIHPDSKLIDAINNEVFDTNENSEILIESDTSSSSHNSASTIRCNADPTCELTNNNKNTGLGKENINRVQNNSESPVLNRRLSPSTKLLPGPSILMKDHNVFGREIQKQVKFSPNDPIVHKIMSVDTIDAADVTTASELIHKHKTTVKEIRTKSNVLVRHITISSKQKST